MNSIHRIHPTQAGMLYHFVSGVRQGVDIEQMVCVLREHVRVHVLIEAWQSAVDRHVALRSRFDWSGPEPGMEVMEPWPVTIDVVDLRGLDEDVASGRITAFLKEDRLRGFDLATLPLMRWTLFQVADVEWRLIWTFHHAVLDGRSFTLVLNEVFEEYEARCRGAALTLPPARSSAPYLDWLSGLNKSEAEHFWRERLEDFRAPNGLAVDRLSPNEAGIAERWQTIETELTEEATSSLHALASECEVTVGTVVLAGWAFLLSRYCGEEDVVIGVTRAGRHVPVPGANEMVGVCINTLPFRCRISAGATVRDCLRDIRARYVAVRPYEHTPLAEVQGWSALPPRTPLFESLFVFENYDLTERLQSQGGVWQHREFHLHEQTNYPLTIYGYGGRRLRLKVGFDAQRIGEPAAVRLVGHLRTLWAAMAITPDQLTGSLPILTDEEQSLLLDTWNRTSTSQRPETTNSSGSCIHHLVEAQVRTGGTDVALVCRDRQATYQELNARANRLSRYLRKRGIGPDSLVGLAVDRSLEMAVGLLGILKAGGAYLPLDPAYPRDRLAFKLKEAKPTVLVTQSRLLSRLPSHSAEVVLLDTDWPAIEDEEDTDWDSGVQGHHLAYVIYTSGSTGGPKGVMVEHRNVRNFFIAMDERIQVPPGSTWLAVTSLSFDISVLELFWTLARGVKVVIHPGDERLGRTIDFSLFYFSANEAENPTNKYRLLIEGARYADDHGFTAVWTPERHFHAFGGLYPNPAVTSAALAMITRNVELRSGSVVAPLHSPVRIAEEWAVVDNLSGGRAAISFASGWMPDDFAIRPEGFADRKEVMMRTIDSVRRLWRGEVLSFPGPLGKPVELRTLPRPIRSELPVWITTAGNPETWDMAARAGANVLTHLLGQSLAEVAAKVKRYREVWREEGHPGRGQVTLMLHTFVGNNRAAVKDIVRQPLIEYLRTSTSLIKSYSWAFPAFQRHGKSVEDVNFGDLSAAELDAVLEHAFERYFESSGLFGTPESCLERIGELKANGIDEVACLIDFGIATDVVLDALTHLNALREAASATVGAEETEDESIGALIRRHNVTHFQCTPSMAGMLLADGPTREALATLRHWMIGGEAFPPALADRILSLGTGQVTNMYGPTETTVWSTTHTLNGTGRGVSIGRPVANTDIYIVDRKMQPVPVGVPGELLIGGAGVVRGYLKRPQLTAERFVRSPFREDPSARLYRTGDLARYHEDGSLEFLGRTDQQVKIRGYRIELGEVEAVLGQHPDVRECVVVAREDVPGDRRLVAYVIAREGAVPKAQTLREFAKGLLPDYMVPAHVVRLEVFPKTPNQKIDRRALPVPADVVAEPAAAYRPPAGHLEESVVAIWQEALNTPQIGADDNFFDLGGHSLLSVQVHSRLKQVLGRDFPLTDLFRFPTVRSLAGHLSRASSEPAPDASAQRGTNRGQARREAALRRVSGS